MSRSTPASQSRREMRPRASSAEISRMAVVRRDWHTSASSADDVELRRQPRGDVERGLFYAQPGRAGVPQHVLIERRPAPGAVAIDRSDRAADVDGDLDRQVVGMAAPSRPGRRPECGHPRECGGLVEQHARPGPLDPGRLARVVDEHTRKQSHPFASTQGPLDVGDGAAMLEHLPPRDHPRLLPQQPRDLVHSVSLLGRGRGHHRSWESCGQPLGRVRDVPGTSRIRVRRTQHPAARTCDSRRAVVDRATRERSWSSHTGRGPHRLRQHQPPDL